MDRKQILILTLAIVVLVSGIFFVVRSLSEKNQVGKNSSQTPIAKKVEKPNNIFSQEQDVKKAETVDAMGSVDAIGEKTLTVKHLEETTVVNITGATPLMITSSQNQTTVGQLADLKKGDAVKVTYDKATKDAKLITLVRP